MNFSEQRPPEWFSIERAAASGDLTDRDFDRIRRHLHALEAQNRTAKITRRNREKAVAAITNYGRATLKRMGLLELSVRVVVEAEKE